jgi:hypothetical protein
MRCRSLLALSLAGLTCALSVQAQQSSVVQESVEVQTSSVSVAVASCPEGKQLIGGSYQAVGTVLVDQAPVYSRPALQGEQAWEVGYDPAGPAFRAVAQCAVVNG